MDVRDPAAIPHLNSLQQTESDRKVPRNLIQQAIDACATMRRVNVPCNDPDSATPA